MSLIDNLEYAFNAELVRRLLVRYFCDKGYGGNFDRRIYPPMLQDLTDCVPELGGKLEIVPHAIDVDPQTGFARLGWNLFVLGSQRMYLGETEHDNLQELARGIDTGIITATDGISRNQRTAREVIGYIVRVLSKSKAGIIRTSADSQPLPQIKPMGNTASNNLYERPKTIRPEGGSQH